MGSTTGNIDIGRAHTGPLMGPRIPYHDPTHPTYNCPDNLTEEQYQRDQEAMEDAFIEETIR